MAVVLACVPHRDSPRLETPEVAVLETAPIARDTDATHGPPHVKVASRGDVPIVPDEPRPLYAGTATLTAYTACDDAGMRCDGITANGAPARAWTTVAAWSAIPFGSRVEVEGLGTFVVEDRGGAITRGKLDIYVGAGEGARRQAMEFGRQRLNVRIYAPHE